VKGQLSLSEDETFS